MARHLFTLVWPELLVEERVELLQAIVAVHPALLVRSWPARPKRGDAALAGDVEESLLEELAAAVKPGHHRADGNPDHLGDLLIGEAFDVEQHRCPELLREGRKSLFHLARDEDRKSTRLNSSHSQI